MARLTSTSAHAVPAQRIVVAAARIAVAVAVLAALDACGGGGSDSGPTATVTSASAAVTRYGQPAHLTINGTNLTNIQVSSDGCTDITLQTTAPTVSSSTTAYYSCTVSGAYSSGFTITSNNTTVGSAAFTVAQPVVTLAVNNGQGVNGNIVIALDGDTAPITVDNFLAYVNSGFYDDTIFHRVVAGFVVQGGGYTAPIAELTDTTPVKTPTYAAIPLELGPGLSNTQWTVAMASDSMGTINSQFYINLVDNSAALDGHYSVFGTVTAGTTVVQEIVAAPATCSSSAPGSSEDCLPIPNVIITSATQTQ